MEGKVIKITTKEDKEEIILYEEQKIRDKPFRIKHNMWPNDTVDMIHEEREIDVTLTILMGDRKYERHFDGSGRYIKLKFKPRQRDMIEIKETEHSWREMVYEFTREDWEKPVVDLIRKTEKNFCLNEEELINEAYNHIKKGYNFSHFQTQREISGCIIDGLAFVGPTKHYKSKIIGFEVKTNKDNYKRLYNQINAYLTICDYVYLIVEDKEVPKDLPFFVGVITVKDGKPLIERKPICLKHEIDEDEYWGSVVGKVKYRTSDGIKNMRHFFKAIDDLKRKLIWNQFGLGWDKMFKEDDSQISEAETNMVEAYFKNQIQDKRRKRKKKKN